MWEVPGFYNQMFEIFFFNSVKLKGMQRLRENKAVQLKGVFLISKTLRV